MFNVINDDWLYCKYKSGEVKQISVRQSFIDAEIDYEDSYIFVSYYK